MTLERWEVRPGLALHLDPELLESNGATFTGGAVGRARGPHYFVCLSVVDRLTEWVAVSSKPARGRVAIRKWGTRSWVDGDSFADLWQVWSVDLDVVRLVARMSDRSQRSARNYGDLESLMRAAV